MFGSLIHWCWFTSWSSGHMTLPPSGARDESETRLLFTLVPASFRPYRRTRDESSYIAALRRRRFLHTMRLPSCPFDRGSSQAVGPYFTIFFGVPRKLSVCLPLGEDLMSLDRVHGNVEVKSAHWAMFDGCAASSRNIPHSVAS
jgi:hypothetical protein